MSTTRQRVSSEQKTTESTHELVQVSSFRIASPVIIIILTLFYVLMFMIWYSPSAIPVPVLSIPLLGKLIGYLIAHPNYDLGLIWFTIIAHTFESYFGVYFCGKHNFTCASTAWYILQTLYCGGFCLRVLFKYKPHK
ncbi:hypothetical protein LOD99_2347 [Oopsacas minuta]|uniref:Transmembrane protein 254 n=1 Tax=Oopsacas minuta TaxID=111878 RepID=A0AAV7K2A2_9METZ|nr:hypothetical protein LOD99_2347 [Oopsacas minuta]